MWKDLFQDATDPAPPPPQLDREERRRYYVAYGFLFLFMILGLAVGLSVSLVVAFGLISGTDAIWGGDIKAILRAMTDPEYSHQSSNIWMPVMLVFGLLGFLAGTFTWHSLFIKSGYLSQAAVQRLSTNRAATERGEKIRVAFGYVLYLAIFLGLGVPMLILGDRSPFQILTSLGMIGMGLYVAVHAFLRYRKNRQK